MAGNHWYPSTPGYEKQLVEAAEQAEQAYEEEQQLIRAVEQVERLANEQQRAATSGNDVHEDNGNDDDAAVSPIPFRLIKVSLINSTAA
jgi:hypothetical protein